MGAEAEYEMAENRIGQQIIGAAMAFHSALAPGLLESANELCLGHELQKSGMRVRAQLYIPIRYQTLTMENGYRIDLLVERAVVVEVKSVEGILPVHRGQLLGYLRLGGFRLGYLLNFNVCQMRDGITRLVNGLK